MSQLTPARRLVDILEDDWDRDLFRGPKALATMLGWSSYHTLRSKGSKAGYPDRTLVRERIIFAELKREKTGPTPDQVVWLDRLATAGGEVYLWRPSDLDEIARVLGSRAIFIRRELGLEPFLKVGPQAGWTPGSLWIPEVGRKDSAQSAQTSIEEVAIAARK